MLPKIILLLLLATFAAFGTSLPNGFLIDDHSLIEDNIFTKDVRYISKQFSQPFMDGYYRPITAISFTLDHLIWKLNPFGYHLTNILLHFFNSVLFFMLLYLLFKDFKVSVITSVLFAIHPINSISVNYISDRGNLLVAFFMLGALIAFCLGHQRRKIQFYVFGLLLFIYALLSRESAILFPFYLLCVFFILYKKGDAQQIAISTTSALSLSLIYLLLRLKYFSLASTFFPDLRLLFSFKAISSFFYMIFKYFSLTIFPHNICMIRTISLSATPAYLGLLYISLIILCVLFLLIKFPRNKVVFFALGWFFIGVLPLYNMMFYRLLMMEGLIMQDNWIYFSSTGLFVIIAVLLIYFKKQINKKLWVLLISVVLLFYSNITIANNALWLDAKRYCLYWLRLNPNNYFANISLADYYTIHKDYEKAKHYFRTIVSNSKLSDGKTLARIPGSRILLTRIFTSLGYILYKEDNLEEAIKYYKTAIEINPNIAEAHSGLACTYLRKNNTDKAILHFNEAIKTNPYHLTAHYNLSRIYFTIGDEQKALEEIKMILSIDPDYFKEIANK